MSLSKLRNLQDKLLGHPAKFAPKALFKDLQSPKVTIAAEIETPQKFSTEWPSPDRFIAVQVNPYALDVSLGKLKYLQNHLLGYHS